MKQKNMRFQGKGTKINKRKATATTRIIKKLATYFIVITRTDV
jgi:hypothetical protein